MDDHNTNAGDNREKMIVNHPMNDASAPSEKQQQPVAKSPPDAGDMHIVHAAMQASATQLAKINQDALINLTDDLVWSVSTDFKLIAANKAFFQWIVFFAGITLKTGDNLLIAEIFPGDLLASWRAFYNKALTGESFIGEIYLPAGKNYVGSWAEVRFTPIYDGDAITGIAAFSRDKTAGKNYENEIIDVNKKLKTAQQIARMGYWKQDLDLHTIYWSDEVYKILGVAPDSFAPSYQNFYNSIYPADREIYEAAQTNARDAHRRLDVELRIIAPAGSIKYVHVRGEFVCNDTGEPIAVEGTIQDITASKKSEAEIRESNQRFEYASKATSDAIWDWDLLTNGVYRGAGFQTIFGYSVNTIKQDLSSWIELIHPEDADRVMKGIHKIIMSDQTNWADEYRFLKTDMSYAFVTDRGFVIRDGEGKGVRMVGAMQDITRQRNEEYALQQSDARLRGIFASQTNYIIRTDLYGNYTYYNQKFFDDFGWITGKTELLGSKTMDSIMEYHHQRVASVVEKCFAEMNQVFKVEIDKPAQNGGVKTTIWDFICLTDSDGAPTEIQCVGIDISDRKKAETGFINALEEKNTILESIGDAFYAVDKNWMVTYWNKEAEKLAGMTKNDILGRNMWDAYPEAVHSDIFLNYHNAITTGQPVHFETNYHSMEQWYEVSAYPSENGLSVYFREITKRKLADNQLKELNENLQKQAKTLAASNAELEQFAYVASHDLQEPLRMVTSFLTLLEIKYGNVIDGKGKNYIHFAVDGARRMRQIILDLLEFSRVGRTEKYLDNLDLNKLVEEVRTLYSQQAQEKNALIEVGPLPVINSYKTPVRQVFQNLISNALKYSRKEVPPLISISAVEFENNWQFAVKDNGIGIAGEYFDKIFIIFQRLHNKDEYSGTGMGLAIAKKITQNLGGSIWVESEEGKGSTFYFTILKQS